MYVCDFRAQTLCSDDSNEVSTSWEPVAHPQLWPLDISPDIVKCLLGDSIVPAENHWFSPQFSIREVTTPAPLPHSHTPANSSHFFPQGVCMGLHLMPLEMILQELLPPSMANRSHGSCSSTFTMFISEEGSTRI